MTAPEADLPPVFTVIMATWGRGRHILPSIQSVLNQTLREFELIVAGDACTDETEAVVRALHDPRLRWLNLAQRNGSQSGPNNAGIAAARGQYTAYLGHDDVWAPTHLQALAGLYAGPHPPDVAVSGIILHLPKGLPGCHVSGLFTDESVKHTHFFPPSCVSHRKEAVDRIGLFRNPGEVRTPVDDDFLRRAAAADLRFASTGVVTVHKFPASMRYLSYLRHDSSEQVAMLDEMALPTYAERVAALVRAAREAGDFMPVMRKDATHRAPGQVARESAMRRGVTHDLVLPLGALRQMRQMPGPCALDWSNTPRFGIRLHLSNPNPRFLLPFSASGPVLLSLRAVHPDCAAFGPLEFLCNDRPVTALARGLRRSLWGWTARYEAEIALDGDRPSLLEFALDPAKLGKKRFGPRAVGFGIGRITLRPLRK